MKGALCGSGDVSMESIPGPGEDDGGGGVVTHSATISANAFHLTADCYFHTPSADRAE